MADIPVEDGLSMSEAGLEFEMRGRAAWIRLNRPRQLNALAPETIVGLERALQRAESGRVRAVVLAGTGRAFCTGVDLMAASSVDDDFFFEQAPRVYETLAMFPAPVIGAINGLALAGGLELVLCCDIVVAAESARLGDAHANYGLLPGAGSSIRLPRIIGPNKAKELLFTGESLTAGEMAELGLVNRVVPDGELEEAVSKLVEVIVKKSPRALMRMKQLVNDGRDQPVSTGLRLENLAAQSHSGSPDFLEGMAAFGEKREPVFSDR